MRLVHDEHKVVQPREVVEIALADVLLKAAEARNVGPGRASGGLGARDLADVEDVDVDVRVEQPASPDAAPVLARM